MTKPLISALIDTYNQERYIEQAILSVLDQGFSPSELEIVVIDDGSGDNTPSIVKKFASRVRYLRKDNGGQASAFNAAIPELQGPIVSFLDADDWWAKGKLLAVLTAFEKNPSLAAVGHGYFEVHDDALPDVLVVPEQQYKLDLTSLYAARVAAAGRPFLTTSRLSVRREALDRILPIPEELVFSADYPIMNSVLALGGALILDRPLCYYRLHSDNQFAFDSQGPTRIRRRYEILVAFLRLIPEKLATLGVPAEVIDTLMESDRIEVERSRLCLGEGGRWRTFRLESQAFRLYRKSGSLGYMLFRGLASALMLLLPPRRFYELRRWYSQHDVKRFRSLLGAAEPTGASALFKRRKIVSEKVE
ncbi:MAG: glycosyltransferase [Candidatus Acidiferrales bacterium]